MRRLPLSLALCAAVLLSAAPAGANTRRFTFTYETAVLPPGERELELWSTARMGRRGYFARFDERLEVEVGVTDRLMTAFYLNFEAVTEENLPDGELVTSMEFAGLSSEWKLKLLDPVADAIGLGLYFELTASTNELEVEAKLLLDKRIGKLLLAFNAVLEQEWKAVTANDSESELVLEADFGLAYFVTPSLSIGLEVRDHNEIPADGGLEHSALYAGPVVSFAQPSWWIAFTFMSQLGAFGHGGLHLELEDHERFNARLLFAVHL